MAKRIDIAEVRRIAQLARLTLTPDEVEELSRDLGNILDYVGKLAQLDTKDVPPTAHAVDLPTKFRDDVVAASLGVEDGLRNAPERIGDGFGVPKIIE